MMNNIFKDKMLSDTQALDERKQASFLGKCVGYNNPVINVILRVAACVFKTIRDELEAQQSLRREINVNAVWSIELVQQPNSMKLIMELGIDLLNIPTLDIGDRKGKTGYIDFVEPEEMRAPIMRGHDCQLRPVFYVRSEATQKINAYHKKGSQHVTAYFPLRRHDYNMWSAGSSGIPLTSYIVDSMGRKNDQEYHKLKAFLSEKQNQDFKLV